MFKGCMLTLILSLLGLYPLASSLTASTPEPPSGDVAEQVTSPHGRYIAQLYRCCEFYPYISAFEIVDTQTGATHLQNLSDVENLDSLAGGIYFAWTPSENYLVITTDNRVTSHGCDELLVYSADGGELVYSSVSTSPCNGLMYDLDIGVLDLCANDDILLTTGRRFTPSTGVFTQTSDKTCPN